MLNARVVTFFSANIGKEFYLGFLPIHPTDVPFDVRIDIAAPTSGHIYVEIPFLSLIDVAELPVGESFLDIPRELVEHGTFIEPRAVYLNSTVNIAVFITVSWAFYGDTYLALPIQTLGKEYTVVTYENGYDYYGTNFLIVGTSDDTLVTVTFNNGSTTYDVINRLDAYQFAVIQEDLSGVRIWSSKPVSVISGNECLFYLDGQNCEKTMVQLLSTEYWDKEYILPRFNANDSLTDLYDDFVRVFSVDHNRNTVCFNFENETKCDNISRGDNFIEESLDNETASLVSNFSLQVFEFSQNEATRDPFVTLLPGISQYMDDYVFVISKLNKGLQNYILVISELEEMQNILLDNASLPVPVKEYSVPDPFEQYSITIYSVALGYHHIVNTHGRTFGVICFGTGRVINYGFPAGLQVSAGKLFICIFI